MAYPKFHGIQLANNSTIDNLNVERLSADPVPVVAGRIWFNTTEKVMKLSSLGASNNVVVKIFATVEEIEAALAQAKTYTDAAVAALRGVTPETLDTLQEIANALNNDPNLYSTLVNLTNSKMEQAKADLRGAVSASLDTLEEVEQALAVLNGGSNVSGSILNKISEATAPLNAKDAELKSEIGTLSSLTTTAKTSLVAAINELDVDLAAEAAARIATDSALDSRVTVLEQQNASRIGDLSTLTTTEKSTIVGAINEVDADLAAEIAARIAGDSALQTSVTAEAAARSAADTALQNSVAAEVSARTDAVAAEAAARIAGDQSLQTSVGTLSSLTTDAKGSLVSAINELDLHIDTNLATATANLAAETAARIAADSALQSAVDSTNTSVNGLQSAMSAEVAARQQVATDLAAEAAARIAADSSLQTSVTAEAAARVAGDQLVVSRVNAGRFTFKSVSAALSHTVTHGLAAEFVNFSVMVQGDDGVWRNDIVPVEEVSTSVLRIDLTESRKIKVVVESMAPLAL